MKELLPTKTIPQLIAEKRIYTIFGGNRYQPISLSAMMSIKNTFVFAPRYSDLNNIKFNLCSRGYSSPHLFKQSPPTNFKKFIMNTIPLQKDVQNVAGTFPELCAFRIQEHAHRYKKDLTLMTEKTLISEEDFNMLLNSADFKIDKSTLTGLDKEYECFYKELNIFYLMYNSKLNQHTLNFFAGFDEGRELISRISPLSVKTESFVSWVTGVDSSGQLIIKKTKIDPPKKIFPSFYPNFTKSLDEILEAYLKSDSSVLVLIGPPGTGKTSAIRKLITNSNQDVLLTYDANISRMDSLFTYFHDSREKYLVIEDADTYISARADGNEVMKKLLNITDGLTSNKDKKVVFSTNLPSIASIDPALLRPGRCFGVLTFDSLNKDQACNVAVDIGVDPELIVKSSYTLAEIFEIKNEPLGTMLNTPMRTFGFV